ncbi:hypothetical protein PYW07_011572 [Mythimna separata]|uniref:Bacterial surface antigen (D15) domain-containing protein n=1 Tax=Mythimna separata TaxID=271217 RepID=A0AAD8DM41_MYTSE|nr:hypothetical protein PYW07_011572 [Mythimna separata]
MGIVHANVGSGCPVDFNEETEVVVDEGALYKQRQALNCVKARVDRVNVDGLKRTKDDIIRGTVENLFQAKDFEDVIVRAQKVRRALDNLGCFRDVCVYIDVSTGPEATPNGLEVTFQVREMARVVGGVNASAGENEGNIVIDIKMPNLWGRGESAQAAYTVGYRNTCCFHVSGSKPLLLRKFQPVISGSVYQQNQEYPWSGYRLLDRGFHFNVDLKTSPQMRHNIQWEALFRDLSVINKSSFAVRESSGPQFRSSLRHNICLDSRDADIFPTEGLWLSVRNELAGIGGSVANYKSELQFQANHLLSEELGLVVQASGAFGLLHDVYGTTLSEHYFLGGPTTLRGFQQRGVGPHVDGQAIGGKIYWASALHLYSPLPLACAREGMLQLVKTHLFLNAGCLAVPERSYFKLSSLSALVEARVACGAGVCVQIGRSARLEINYVVPLKTQARDIPVTGLQFGVGAHFL